MLTVLRNGTPLPPIGPIGFDRDHKVLGLGLGVADQLPIAATPAQDSLAADAHVPGGAVLTRVNGRPVSAWFDVWAAARDATADKPLVVVAKVGGQEKRFELKGMTDTERNVILGDRLSSVLDEQFPLQYATYNLQAKGPVDAFKLGVGETRDAIVQVKSTLMAMVHGSISPKEISGPLGILAVGYKFAEAGSTKLLWFLSIISANLAVMNFLPIPVVDGGLFTFLIIEKLKGSPISQRTQAYAQYVGLALLLSVFLFATWQDVFRMHQLFP